MLLLNLGGPDKLADVQPFLYNLFADPDILRLPQSVRFLQPTLAKVNFYFHILNIHLKCIMVYFMALRSSLMLL